MPHTEAEVSLQFSQSTEPPEPRNSNTKQALVKCDCSASQGQKKPSQTHFPASCKNGDPKGPHAGDSTPRASPPLDLAKPSPHHPHDKVPRSTPNSRSNPRLGRSSAEAAVRGKEHETTHGPAQVKTRATKARLQLSARMRIAGGRLVRRRRPGSTAEVLDLDRFFPASTFRRGTGGLHHSNTNTARGTRLADLFLDEYRGFHRIRTEVTSECCGKSLNQK